MSASLLRRATLLAFTTISTLAWSVSGFAQRVEDGVDIAYAAQTPFFHQPTTVTAVGDNRPGRGTMLAQNIPNPCAAPGTRIMFSLREAGEVSVRVYDAAGRLVRILTEGPQYAGSHEVIWNARDARGREVANGVYYYRLDTQGFSQTRRMVLLR